MYIKDLSTGKVRKYGTDCHDSLRISEDGNYLFYEHLQNGGGSGPFGDYRFVTDREGRIPAEDEVLLKRFADAYFNIGGFYNKKALKEQMSQHDKEIFMEGMKEFPDKFFDLAIVDPPYGIGCMSMNYTKSGAVRTHGYAAAKRRDYRKQTEWDVKPSAEYFEELFRVSKAQIIWGGELLF